MQNKTLSRKHRLGLGTASALSLLAATLATTGCGVHMADVTSTPIQTPGTAMGGKVFGGQQPISGATIQLYAASTNGYGAASYALLNTAVLSDTNGGFSITGDYTCPSASSLVYLTATGGNPGAGTNAAVAEMTALGACGNLSASTYVMVNEVTTVASVYALAPFMSGYASVGTSSTNVQGLTNAFATVNKLVNTATGSAAAATLPAGASGPVAMVNTLGNIIAACVNTTGTSSAQCATLFSKATSSTGAQPTDTIGAALNIARNPGQNVSALFALNSGTAPFQPSSSTANDFTLSIKYKPTVSTPSASAVAANGDLWVTNSGNSTISVLNAATSTATIYTGGGLSGPAGIAFDQAGNAWVTDKTSSKLSVFTAAGVGTQTTASNLSSPTGVAIDGAGLIWVTNSNSVAAVNVTGTTVNSSTLYTAGGVTTPVAVVINPY